jgi:hypothetical protein
MSRALAPLFALLCVACPKGPVDSASETGEPSADPCPVDELAEGELRVDPDGPLTQLHPSAAWDGEAVWVAYVLPEPDSSYFDIWATRIATSGETLVAPFQLDGGEGHNETYARVAVAGGRVVVAWQADNGTGQDNMDLVLRSFAVDGSDLDGSPVVVEPSVQGAAQAGNGWMPALTADPTGGFALGGAWALSSVSTFQALIMDLDAAGALSGEATVPELNGEQSHYYPSIAAGPAGERLLAWESWTASGGTEIHLSLDGALAAFGEHDDAGLPFVGWERGATGQPYLAYYAVHGSEYDIALVGGDLVGAPVVTSLGQPGELDHSPILAAGEGGAVVAWMRNRSGLSNDLVLQPVRLEGEGWALGEELVLETETAVAPYLPGLTWLCEDAWFVTWSEGDNPDYVVKGRFLRFEGFGG